MVLTPSGIYRFRLANTAFVPSFSGEGSTASEFRIHKSAEAIQMFPRLRDLLRFRNVVQVTGDDMGSVALTSLVAAPAKIVAVSAQDESASALSEFAQRRGISDQIAIHTNVALDDRARLAQIVIREFGSRKLETVVDDVSEALEPGLLLFESLFPHLAPGGSYIIERWSWDHFFLEGFLTAIDPSETEWIDAMTVGSVARVRSEKGEILEAILPVLLDGVRAHPGVFAGLTVSKHWLEVRRGPARVDPAAFGRPLPS